MWKGIDILCIICDYCSNIYHIIWRIFLFSSLHLDRLLLRKCVKFPVLFWCIFFYHFCHSHFVLLTYPQPAFCLFFSCSWIIYATYFFYFHLTCWLCKRIRIRHYQILLAWFTKHISNFSWESLKKPWKYSSPAFNELDNQFFPIIFNYTQIGTANYIFNSSLLSFFFVNHL